jgi:hypothetical protein
MPGREYVCDECRHRFGAPEGAGRDVRALMCPSCGSMDLSIVLVERAPRTVMRAVEQARADDGRRKSSVGA